MGSIDRTELRAVMLEEFRDAWTLMRESHPNEQFYSFGFYTTALVDYLMVTASTEEGLSDVTERYLESDGTADPALERLALRWSPCDSPLHMEGADLLPKSTLLRRAGPDPSDDTPEADESTGLVFEVVIEVLRELDRDGVFGTGPERERLVLGIWMGDQSNEDRSKYARLLNPPSVHARFVQEMESGCEAHFKLRHRSRVAAGLEAPDPRAFRSRVDPEAAGVPALRRTRRWQKTDRGRITGRDRALWFALWIAVGLITFCLGFAAGLHGDRTMLSLGYPLQMFVFDLLDRTTDASGGGSQSSMMLFIAAEYPAIALAGLFAEQKSTLARITRWYVVLSAVFFVAVILLSEL